MKSRSKIIALMAFLVVTLFSACEKTDTDGPNVSDRDKYIGTWAGISTGPGGQRNFNMVITASASAPDQVKIERFDGLAAGQFIFANIGGNSISLVTTLVGQETYAGSGSYVSTNKLSFTFTVDDGQTTENRTATATK